MQNNSEVAFQQIFELAPAAFILVNNEGKIEFINRQSEKLFSYKKTELSGQSVYFLISENFSENYHKFESYLRTPHTIEGAVCLDLMALRKDGTVFPVEIALNSLDNMVIIVVHDITDKKIAESNQALFTSIINSSDDAIISKTLDGIITSWNRGAERLFGYTMKEAVGRHVSILIPPSHISDEHEIIEKIRKGEYIQHYETQRIRKDGSLVHISLTVSPILDQNAKIIGASKIARNISEKKITEDRLQKNESLFRSIALNIPGSLVIVMDMNHNYILIEGDLMDKLGYNRQDYEGKNAKEIMPLEQYEATKPLMDRVFEGDRFSVERSSAQGDFVIHFVPLKDDNEAVYSAMMIVLDISEIKKAERDIHELNLNLEQKVIERTAQLETSNKELESFSYSVSHDLRAPLRAINGYAKMLEEDYGDVLDTEAKRLIGVIQQNAKKMGVLIDDLLTFSRLGRKEIEKSRVDMKKLVEEVVFGVAQGTINNSNISIGNLHSVSADYALVSQVWVNLVSNAIKYSSLSANPEIEINSRNPDGFVEYSIKDNGVGFDMRYANKLFGVFQRLHSSAEFEGTGVGLAIVKRIVEKHGGKAWAYGEEGNGATFYFNLPD